MTRRRRPTLRTICALLALALWGSVLLVGCGASSTGPATLSKRAYIEQSNALQRDAADAFERLDASAISTPVRARDHIKAFDVLIAGYGELTPPDEWRAQHAASIAALTEMRQAIAVISRAAPRNRAVITTQLGRYADARDEFEAAVRSINASR